MPLWLAGLITAVVTFLILALQSRGFRPMEAVISVLLGVVFAYLLGTQAKLYGANIFVVDGVAMVV